MALPSPSIPKKEQRNSKVPPNPIFLVGQSGRCGSTVCQRLIGSSKDIFMWGEPQGLIQQIINFQIQNYLRMTKYGHLKVVNNFKKHGFKNGWPANLNSPLNINFKRLFKRHMNIFYKNHPNSYSRWGIKSIDWSGDMIQLMHFIYPNAGFVFVHRDWDDTHQAYLKKKNWWRDGIFEFWKKQHSLQKDVYSVIPPGMKIHHIHLEELLSNRNEVISNLEEFLMLQKGSIDKEILDIKKDGLE